MSLSLGIVGLPNVGKSTLFKALTKKQIDIANYPFCTIEPNVGIVEVPDVRLQKLSQISQSTQTIPAVVEFVDIAGLVEGANKGEGLGNKFLANIREVDAIVHVVRHFTDPNVIHVNGKIEPTHDIEIINTELILKDLETLTKRQQDLARKAKGQIDKLENQQLNVINKILPAVEQGQLIEKIELNLEEKKALRDLNLLTIKPIIYVVNVDEQNVNQKITLPNIEAEKTLVISAKIEAELSELNIEEKQAYLQEIGLQQSGLDKLITTGYQILNLITFFTSGPKETRAWTVEKNSTAPQAAGKIHTDFEANFIRAEICHWQDFVNYGEQGCKDKGLMRLEGKDYIFQDGDTVYFRVGK
ncbi:MAG: redox-regulated ATPase YchF [Patescibacteria group bacterium]|nr:redox-regulated ATPase YchF [Patescibacteria group bacterium]